MDHRAQCSWFQNNFPRKIISSEIFPKNSLDATSASSPKADGPAKMDAPFKSGYSVVRVKTAWYSVEEDDV